MIKTDMQIQY